MSNYESNSACERGRKQRRKIHLLRSFISSFVWLLPGKTFSVLLEYTAQNGIAWSRAVTFTSVTGKQLSCALVVWASKRTESKQYQSIFIRLYQRRTETFHEPPLILFGAQENGQSESTGPKMANSKYAIRHIRIHRSHSNVPIFGTTVYCWVRARGTTPMASAEPEPIDVENLHRSSREWKDQQRVHALKSVSDRNPVSLLCQHLTVTAKQSSTSEKSKLSASKPLLSNVSAFFPQNTLTAIIGPSGAGKVWYLFFFCFLFSYNSAIIYIYVVYFSSCTVWPYCRRQVSVGRNI